MKIWFFIFSVLLSSQVFSQKKIASWKVTVSTDSLLIGNRLKVNFTLKNAKGRNFVPPNFSGFKVVMGPNQSSSMSVINGVVSQESSFSYVLEPIEEGSYYIEPASIEVGGDPLETAPLEVIVFPNPDGIIQQDLEPELRWDQLPWDPPKEKPLKGKKKKKIYKI